MHLFYCILFFALLVFLSYFIVPRFFPGIPLDKLWGGIRDPRARVLYTLSIMVSAVAFLVIISYYGMRAPEDRRLFWALTGFLFFSILWMPLMFLHKKYPPPNSPYHFLTPLVLGMVAFFALFVFFILFQNQQKDGSPFHSAAVVAAGYLLFHTLFLDFILFTIADIA